MNFTIETLPTQHFAYMRRQGAYGTENYVLMETFKKWAGENGLLHPNSVVYAIARDNPAITPPEQCRYDVGIVAEAEIESAALHSGTIDAGKYGVFKIPHTAEAVGQFWGTFVDTLTAEGHSMDETRLTLERYAVAVVKEGFCEFCVPVL